MKSSIYNQFKNKIETNKNIWTETNKNIWTKTNDDIFKGNCCAILLRN